MTREQVEQKIREVVATETSAIRLSNILFTPDGLFSHLAADEAERRVLVATPLFREALHRFTELQEIEVDEFSRSIDRYRATHGDPVPPKAETKSHVA